MACVCIARSPRRTTACGCAGSIGQCPRAHGDVIVHARVYASVCSSLSGDLCRSIASRFAAGCCERNTDAFAVSTCGESRPRALRLLSYEFLEAAVGAWRRRSSGFQGLWHVLVRLCACSALCLVACSEEARGHTAGLTEARAAAAHGGCSVPELAYRLFVLACAAACERFVPCRRVHRRAGTQPVFSRGCRQSTGVTVIRMLGYCTVHFVPAHQASQIPVLSCSR